MEDKYSEALSRLRKLREENKNLTVNDYTPNSSRMLNTIETFGDNMLDVDLKTYQKYNKYGVNFDYDRFNSGELDIQLAHAQSGWNKLGNALAQTVVSEMGIGTVKAFSDLYDIVAGNVFKGDNDYQNPVSVYLENLQNQFKESTPIYQDPTKSTIKEGALGDWGWWMNNLPSIMSSLTLMVPGRAVAAVPGLLVKGVSYLGKANKVAKGIRTAEEMSKMSKAAKWLNSTEGMTASSRILENGLNALTMRTLENYQEGRQVYNDVWKQSYKELSEMSDDEYNNFINNNQKELEGYTGDLNDRANVAKQMAKKAADRTFVNDYRNIIWDVIQVNALRNPLKYTKNMRATAAVNKAQRESIQATANVAREADKQIKDNLLNRVGHFFTDRAKAYKVVGSELSEGVEEAVNYIAQQEGMSYANIMLNHDDVIRDRSDRILSYFKNGELYDAAFWGVLGGVTFQGLGSGFNATSNKIKGSIKNAKTNKSDSKESAENSSEVKNKLINKFETTENKARTSKINKRFEHFTKLQNKLSAIDSKHNPDNMEEELTPLEQEHAREAAIDEYITNITLDAIDSGTWDLTKDYLLNKDVQQSLRQIGLIDDNSITAETLIARMDATEKSYNDNLIMLNSISSKFRGGIPMEYIQIMARDNVFAQKRINDINNRISDYELSAEENAKRFEANLDRNLDYKTLVDLRITASRLGQLKAQRKNITKDAKRAKSIEGQNQLNKLDREIKFVEQHLDDLASKSNYNMPITTIWANAFASTVEYDEQSNRFNINDTSDDYLDFLGTIASRDTKTINDYFKKQGRDFKLTDDQIVSAFGENGNSTGLYHVLNQNMELAFDPKSAKDLKSRAKELNDDLAALSTLNLEKLRQEASLYNTDETVNNKINELHNYMNEARRKAIEQAENTLFTLATKYEPEVINKYIFENNRENTDNIISERDKKALDDALLVLNLTADSNIGLADNIRGNLLQADLIRAIQEEAKKNDANIKDGENSSASQNRKSDDEKQKPIVDKEKGKKSKSEQKNGQIEPSEDAERANKEKPQQTAATPLTPDNAKVKVNTTVDGDVSFELILKDSPSFGIPFTENENGNIYLDFNSVKSNTTELPYLLPYNSLFNNPPNKPTNGIKEITPVIIRRTGNPDNEFEVITKGTIVYETKASTSPTGVESPTDNKLKVTSDGVANIPPDNEEAEAQFNDKIRKEIAETLKAKGLENITLEYINEVINDIKNKYLQNASEIGLNEHRFDVLLESLNRMFVKSLNKQGFLADASKVLMSTITEDNGSTFASDFVNAVDKMISTYCKDFNIDKIDNKYYISLEDLLRRCNYVYEDKGVGKMMYDTIINYLNTKEAKNKYVIKDLYNNNVVSDANKSVEEKLNKDYVESSHRINISRIDLSNNNVSKVFNSILPGDVLDWNIDDEGGHIYFRKDGVVVGEVPIPGINQTIGGYEQINMGWLTHVWKDLDGKVHSNLKPIFQAILDKNTEETKNIYNSIIKIAYGNLSKDDKNSNLIKLYNDVLHYIQTKHSNNIPLNINETSNSNKINTARHLVNLFRYFDTSAVDPSIQETVISKTLDNWFEKLYNEYDSIITFNRLNQNVIVKKITSGQLIKLVQGATNPDAYYAQTEQSNTALAEPDKCVIVASNKDANTIVSTKKVSISSNILRARTGSGAISVVIPKRNTNIDETGYTEDSIDLISATTTRFVDDELKGDAGEIYKAVKEEFTNLYETFITNPTDENLNAFYTFCHKVFHNTGKQDYNDSREPNVGLFFGVTVYRYGKNFAIGTKNGSVIRFSTPTTTTDSNTMREINSIISIKQSGSSNWYYLNVNEDNSKLIQDTINEILGKARFNVSFDHINGDNNNASVSGFINRDQNTREVSIEITNSKTGKIIKKTYPSFNDLVIKGGFIKVNTKIENGSNYTDKTTTQSANRVLEVSWKSDSYTTPVRKNDVVNSTPEQTDVRSVFEDNKANTEDILKLARFNTKDLDIIPKTIIFADDLNKQKDEYGKWIGPNAESNVTTGVVRVGNKWVDMFNEVGEFETPYKGRNKLQAIRKLVHERIHIKLHEKPAELDYYIRRFEEVYKEFEQSLKDNNIPTNNDLYKYLFKNKKTHEETIEEFIVESLTSNVLVNYLNTVSTTIAREENKKETLWDKFIKIINDLFGWGVKENTLRDKAIEIFRHDVSDLTSTKTTESDNDGPVRINTRLKTRRSDVVENNELYPSMYDFAKQIDNKERFYKETFNGEISIICK